MPLLRWSVGFAVLLLCFSSARAQDLGKVVFPSDCSAAAASSVTGGIALLHSFQYQQAKSAFEDAAKGDPQCAIAYWGQALSLYHALWDFPQPAKLKEGRGYLAGAGKARSASPRERAYLEAAKVFFRDDAKLSHLERVRGYSTALAALREKYPEDVEAAAFYGLSLVALAENDRDHDQQTALRKQALALLDPLFRSNPANPGLAHYMIHAADTPELAPAGLEAARSYAKIAPDSSHAIHMPSHIFVRLGLWRESIASNIAASDAAARAAGKHLAEAHYQTHAMDFLNYSYLQNGEEAKAREVVRAAGQVAHASEESRAELASRLAARTALELHRWKEAAELPVPEVKLVDREAAHHARLVGKARLGDAPGARAELDKLREIWAAEQRQQREEGYPVEKEKRLTAAEVWILFAEGKHDQAVREMRAVAERQEASGVDSLAIPVREQLGDMLLERKRPSDAAREYSTALDHSPNRFDSLLGLARSFQMAGDAAASGAWYAKLIELAGSAGDRPELGEAREAVRRSETARK
jgi:Tfp pilus assembly protein PilF